MSTKAPVKTQAKTPAGPAAARIPQPPVAEPEHVAERPDMAAQLEGAARLGHSLGAVGMANSAPPIIQRQELPEEEEEELQLKREPAAVQRQELPEEEKEELQTKPANGVQRQGGREGFQLDDETAGRINRARGSGQPLEGALQEQISEALGHDFSGVRVHTDAEADALSRQLSAKAFTTGPDIFFKCGAYDPGSGSGRELIAHELTHVIQQSTGRVRGDQSGMVVRPSGDAFEQEAEDVARQGGERQGKTKGEETRQLARPDLARPADILALQRTVGNPASQRLLSDKTRGGEPHGKGRAERLPCGTNQSFTEEKVRESTAPMPVREVGHDGVWHAMGDQVQMKRAKDPKEINEGEYAVVSKGEEIKYPNLAAGCIGVTAWFEGGGMGYHLALMLDNQAQLMELGAVLSGRNIVKVKIRGDCTWGSDWWYRIKDEEEAVIREGLRSTEAKDKVGLEPNESWKNDGIAAWRWWTKYFGEEVDIDMDLTRETGPHLM